MRHPAPGRSQSAGQAPLFFNYSYLKTNKQTNKICYRRPKKKAPESSLPSPDRRESPRPGDFVVWVGFFNFFLVFFPADFDVSFPQRNADFTAGARHGERLPRPPLASGTAFLPVWEGKRRNKNKTKNQTGTDSPGVRAFPRPGPPSASSHADASPGPARSLGKRDTENETFCRETQY